MGCRRRRSHSNGSHSSRGLQTTGVRAGPYTHTPSCRTRAKNMCLRSSISLPWHPKKRKTVKVECTYNALTQRIGLRSSLSFVDYCNRGVALPLYITMAVPHLMYQPFFLLDHQRDARPDYSPPCYPHWEWYVLVSSQAHRICSQSQTQPFFRWDYLSTLWLEYRLIRGQMKLRWPLVRPFPHSFCART